MSALFSPATAKGISFRNRVVMPPMVCAGMPDMKDRVDPDGHVGEAILDHHTRRARAGTGMIIVEATAVDAGGRCWKGGLCAHSDEYTAGLRRLAKCIQEEGAVACIQLLHGGPASSPELAGGAPVNPNTLSVEEILAIEGRFAEAACRCIAAGFDAVELHGAHGFLLDSFLSTERNARSDGYGGTIDGRMRMLVETCGLVRSRIGENSLLGCRISVFNHLAEGFTPRDFERLVQGIEVAGVDLLHLSVMEGAALDGYFGSDRTLGQWARASTCLPIILAGQLGNPRDAERAIAEGHADFAAVGSAMLENAEWTQRAREVLEGQDEGTSKSGQTATQ